MLLAAAASCSAVLPASVAQAQAFPIKPIRIIVPLAPGGAMDNLARLYGQKLAEKWGQPVLIDNRPGANGLKFPANSLKDVVEYAKANPGKVNVGYAIVTGLVVLELFKSMAGIEMTNVPYKGASAVIPALLAGDIDIDLSDIPTHAPHIRAGRLRGLATTGPSRSIALPDLPTVAEAGYPGLEVRYWYGLVAPADTPKVIVDKLNAEVNAILRLPEIQERLTASGMDPAASTPEQFATLIKADGERWSKVIRAANIHLD